VTRQSHNCRHASHCSVVRLSVQRQVSWTRLPFRHAALVLAALVGMAACDTPALPEPSSSTRIEAQCPPLSADSYLVVGSLTPNATNDAVLRAAYTGLLRKASAPPLWCGEGPAEAYRLLWLPTYGPALIAVATRDVNGWMLQGMEFTTKDVTTWKGWAAGKRTEARASDRDMAPMLEALQRGAFWSTPSYQQGGEDGVMWTIEGRRGTGYRAVTRWSDLDPSLTDAVRSIITLSGLTLPERLRKQR
jgi:hypothetical protein